MAGMQPGGADVWTCPKCGDRFCGRIGPRCTAPLRDEPMALTHKLSPDILDLVSLQQGDSELGRDARVCRHAWDHFMGPWLQFIQVRETADHGPIRARLERIAIAMGFVAV